MTNEFSDHIEKFVNSLKENLPEIYYQSFDFSNLKDNRSELLKFNADKNKVSFLNLEMIADVFQLFTAVHSALEQTSSREFGVEVPHRLANTRSIGDALRVFGGYGKSYIIVVSIASRSESEELFEKISRIENVKKMSQEQMQECMKKNYENIRRYYSGTTSDQESVASRNPIGEIVTKMIASKTL